MTEFILIADDSEAVHARRAGDRSRNRPQRSAEELASQQDQALLAAFHAALVLGVPLHVLTPAQFDAVRRLLAMAANVGE